MSHKHNDNGYVLIYLYSGNFHYRSCTMGDSTQFYKVLNNGEIEKRFDLNRIYTYEEIQDSVESIKMMTGSCTCGLSSFAQSMQGEYQRVYN